jgi:glycosyltransferase involved in cell wall biosynthesis
MHRCIVALARRCGFGDRVGAMITDERALPAPALSGPPLLGPPLSVIVPATGSRPCLPRGLAAIDAATWSGDQLIVVRDAPLPGPASARNQGAAEASNEILVFIDADVEVKPDALAGGFETRIARASVEDIEFGAR